MRSFGETFSSKERANKANDVKYGRSLGTAVVPKQRAFSAVADEASLSHRKIQTAASIRRTGQSLSANVRSGEMSLLDAKRLAALAPDARRKASETVQKCPSVAHSWSMAHR